MRFIGKALFIVVGTCMVLSAAELLYFMTLCGLSALSIVDAPEPSYRVFVWVGGMLAGVAGLYVATTFWARSHKSIRVDSAYPPAFFECLFWLVLPRNREGIKHDLDEDFGGWVAKLGVKRARRRYRIEVLKSVAPLAMQFARRRLGGALEAIGKRVSGQSKVSGD